jgi:hypothetical protein
LDRIEVVKNFFVYIEILLVIAVSPVFFESCITDSDEKTLSAGVALTFDDTIFLESWVSMIDTLVKMYDIRATFFVDHFDQLNEQRLAELRFLKNLGSEIGYHGLRHRDAVNYCKSYSIERYIEDEILPGLVAMKQKGFSPSSFAYPLGNREQKIDERLLEYFKILRGTYAYGIKKPPASYYHCDYHSTHILNGVKIDCDSPYAMSDIFEGLEYARQYNCVIILYGHGTSKTILPLYVLISRLEKICSFVAKHNMKFYIMSELVEN